jgi:hypothetical protein
VPVHIDRKPFPELATPITQNNVALRLRPFWSWVVISITPHHLDFLPEGTPTIPVVVDPGCSHSLDIDETHLFQFTSNRAESLPPVPGPRAIRRVDASGRVVERARREARLWLHAYPEDAGVPPLNLGIADDIVVNPSEAGEEPPPESVPLVPPFPLLGGRCLFRAGLTVILDYPNLQLTITHERNHPGIPNPSSFIQRWLRRFLGGR